MMGVRLGPLLRFHLRLGVRFALRRLIPLIAPPIALVGLDPDPGAALVLASRRLLTEAADPAWIAAVGMVSLAVATASTRQVTRDMTGWVHALPVDAADRRRGLVLSCIAAQAPVLLVLAFLAAGAAVSGQTIDSSGLLGLFILPVCAAYAALPVRRRAVTTMMGLSAGWLCVRGGWPEVAMASLLLLIAESSAGPLRRSRKAKRLRRSPAFVLPLILNWRASGWRAAGAYLIAALPIVIAALALSNNRLDDPSASLIVRLAAGLAVSLTIASLAQTIASRRPPWPWSRSLPLSSAARVLHDALFMVVSSMPVILAACWLEPVAALTASMPVVWIAARAAGHLRKLRRHPLLDPGNRTALDGVITSGLVALLPWVSGLMVVLALHALRTSAKHERDLKVSRQPDEDAIRAEVPS